MEIWLPPVLHLGALHPVEALLVYLLAFGPFAVLAVVVVVRRRQDRLEDDPAVARSQRPSRTRTRAQRDR